MPVFEGLERDLSEGHSSGLRFAGDLYLYGGRAEEGEDAEFRTELEGAEPVSYRWFRAYPWGTNWSEVTGATNWYFVIPNVDSWVERTEVMCLVSNGAGETVWLGPAYVVMVPKLVHKPGTNYAAGAGPASRYPMTINVFGMPTNFNELTVRVTIWGLTHTRSADVSIMVVSPSGKGIMLMSNVGGTNSVSGAILCFTQAGFQMPQAERIPSGGPWHFQPNNYGQILQMPRVGPDPPPPTYSANLGDLRYDDPNGGWKLYIYDWSQGGIGQLSDSWVVEFEFQ